MIATVSVSLPLFAAPHRMARRGLFRGPGLFDLVDQRRGERYVVQFSRHTSSILVRPGKELQRLVDGGRIARLLVHQNEAGAGDRPTLGARLIGQYQVVAI